MPFLRPLAWSEMKIALSRIWTWLAESISNDNSSYNPHTWYFFLYEAFECLNIAGYLSPIPVYINDL